MTSAEAARASDASDAPTNPSVDDDPAPTTVREAIAEARARGLDRLDAQLLLAATLGTRRTALIADDARPLDADALRRWRAALERRADGEPLAYLLGTKEFFGLALAVTPAVLVPRPETELLVERALAIAKGDAGVRRVVDLGTGSGAIALAVASRRPDLDMTMSDVDEAALDVARGNAHRLGLRVEARRSSWWRDLPRGVFDLALSNPPYVAEADPALAALRHEPRGALTPGGDGFAAIAEIVAGAPARLRAGGQLWIEHGFDQGERSREAFAAAGFVDVETVRDLAGHERITGGRRPLDT